MSLSTELTRMAQNVGAITANTNAIFEAIESKGVSVPSGSTLSDCPALIASISTTDRSPDIPSGYKKNFRQVEFLQSNKDCVIVNLTGTCTSSDILKYHIYIKNLRDRSNNYIQLTNNVNSSGTHVFTMRLWTVYHSGQCQYDGNFDDTHYGYIKNYSDANPLVRDEIIVVNAPNLCVNGSPYINTLSVPNNYAYKSIKLLACDSAGSPDIALGTVEILDASSLDVKEKLVPCENLQTGEFGYFYVNNNTFYGHYSSANDITEFIPS